MATIQEQLQKVKILTSQKISDELFNFIKSIQKKFTDLNEAQLYNRSEDIFGEPIGFYSPATEAITINRALLGQSTVIKKAGSPFTMKDSGDFLRGLFIDVKNGAIYFGSRDSKTAIILQNDSLLSTELFGLQDDNLRELISNDLLPFILQYQRKILNV